MQVSWVYLNFALLCLFIIGAILFVVTSIHFADTIWKYHDTVSSFCARKNSWEHRYFLFLSILTSLNLLMLHFEEFNSRHPLQTDTEILLFFAEIPAIFCLMLVGICYTRGNNPSTMNLEFDFGVRGCDIKISEAIHSAFALFFFLVVTGVNVVHTVHLMNQRLSVPDGVLNYWCFVSIAWCTFNVMVGIAFVTVQGILFCDRQNEERVKEEEEVKKEDESGDIDECQSESSSEWKAHCQNKISRLRMVSFVLELLWLTSIVFQDGCNSIYRNRLFPWFGDGPLPTNTNADVLFSFSSA